MFLFVLIALAFASGPADPSAAPPPRAEPRNPPANSSNTVPAPRPDPVVLRIGPTEVLRSELDAIWDRLDPETRSLYEKHGGKAALVIDVVQKKRFALDAQRQGLDRVPEIRNELLVARESVLFQYFVERVLGPKVVPEDELRKEYERRLASFHVPERFHVRSILVTPKRDRSISNRLSDDAASQAEASRKIEFLVGRLAEGADFSTLAAEYSEEEAALKGGDLGWVGRGDLAPAVEEAVRILSPGQFSDPVAAPEGFRIVQLVEHQPEGPLRFDVVRDKLLRQLLAERQPALSARIEEATADLDNRYPVEFVDPTLRWAH